MPRKLPSPERRLLDAASFIQRSFRRRPTLVEIGKAIGLSPFHLQRTFKRHFGESPLQMVTRLQIDLAKELLRQGVPIKEVAGRCGFSQQSHFTHRFKIATGTPPARWLRVHNGTWGKARAASV